MLVLPVALAAVTALVVTPSAAIVLFTTLQVPCAILALRMSEPSPQVRARLADRDRRAWITLIALAAALVGVALIGASREAL